MNEKLLRETAQKMVAKGKGILASDESNPSANKSLARAGVAPTEENRRRYRELFICTPGINKYLNGVILSDETFGQRSLEDMPFREVLSEQGILVGIKVDMSTEEIPNSNGEKFTQGLDGLDDRLQKYFDEGANFAKWRSIFSVGEGKPSDEAVEINSLGMAMYAAMCQKQNIVPIVEPEVLYEGNHTVEQAFKATLKVLKRVFKELSEHKVYLPGVILKTSMVLPGKDSGENVPDKAIAQATVEVLRECVPEKIGGVVFLSGGQTPNQASQNLDEIAKLEPLPWEITFSFLRAIEGPALEVWQGKDENVEEARKVFLEMLKNNVAADAGEFED